MSLTLTVVALALATVPRAAQAQPETGASGQAAWRYVVPAAGDPFDHAPFRALVLSREKPDELVEKTAYRGEPARRRYARIRFGSPSSIRVSIVLDATAKGEVDLYVDADRNLRIDDRDRVAQPPPLPRPAKRLDVQRIWQTPLDVALVENESRPDRPARRRVSPGRQRADAGLCHGGISRGNRGADIARE